MGDPHPQLWVALAFAAAGFQTLRFMLQKVLSSRALTPTGATFARFLYSAPLVVSVVLGYLAISGTALAFPGGAFLAFAVTGGLAQIIATICVVTLFKTRNFAVGLALMKTEVILSVAVGLLLLGEGVGWGAMIAIATGSFGVVLLSTPPQITASRWRDMINQSIGLGLSSGVLFAVSAVCYRGASLEVASDLPFLRAGVTLAVVTSLQMMGMGMWLWWRDRPQLTAVWSARRVAVWIGLLSLAGSFCWFSAFTLQNAAYVKAVGQVELALSLIVSILVFGERSSLRELVGMGVLSTSIIALVLAT